MICHSGKSKSQIILNIKCDHKISKITSVSARVSFPWWETDESETSSEGWLSSPAFTRNEIKARTNTKWTKCPLFKRNLVDLKNNSSDFRVSELARTFCVVFTLWLEEF